MAVISFSREASKDEMGREIDRRGAVIDTLTEERDRLKEIVDGTGLATAAIVAERDQLVKERDEFKRLFEECGIARDCSGFLGTVPDCIEYLDAERDRLALANAELLAAFDDLMSWFPDKPTEPMWQMKAGEWGADAAIDEARALLIKHKATSTEREGE